MRGGRSQRVTRARGRKLVYATSAPYATCAVERHVRCCTPRAMLYAACRVVMLHGRTFSTVYRVKDRKTQTVYALKKLKFDFATEGFPMVNPRKRANVPRASCSMPRAVQRAPCNLLPSNMHRATSACDPRVQPATPSAFHRIPEPCSAEAAACLTAALSAWAGPALRRITRSAALHRARAEQKRARARARTHAGGAARDAHSPDALAPELDPDPRGCLQRRTRHMVRAWHATHTWHTTHTWHATPTWHATHTWHATSAARGAHALARRGVRVELPCALRPSAKRSRRYVVMELMECHLGQLIDPSNTPFSPAQVGPLTLRTRRGWPRPCHKPL